MAKRRKSCPKCHVLFDGRGLTRHMKACIGKTNERSTNQDYTISALRMAITNIEHAIRMLENVDNS